MRRASVTPCPYPHWRLAFGPFCTKFVYPRCWHFDNGSTSMIVDVLIEHGGLPHVLPLVVHLIFFFFGGDHSKTFLLFEFVDD